MIQQIFDLQNQLLEYGNGPLLSEMPRASLADKGIAGPTAAHRIEEIHTPLNLAYVTFTTGSAAFQNLVGVTQQELPERVAAGKKLLDLCGLRAGAKVIITYPPLVNVFCNQALTEQGVQVRFIQRPSRDALLVELCLGADCVIGESSFLRAALQDARRLGMTWDLPSRLILIAAGTPLDPGLLDEASLLPGAVVHDLYGCQEFGWIALDGVPLRSDVRLCTDPEHPKWSHVIVGGLAVGDMLQVGTHPLNKAGFLCTNTIRRSSLELETVLTAGAVESLETVQRTARTILRLKAKIVRVSPAYRCGASQTELFLSHPCAAPLLTLCGPESTKLLDDLTNAQKMYQRTAKNDPVWSKLC